MALRKQLLKVPARCGFLPASVDHVTPRGDGQTAHAGCQLFPNPKNFIQNVDTDCINESASKIRAYQIPGKSFCFAMHIMGKEQMQSR